MTPKERIAVVLIGHGAPATDCPPRLVGELMALQWRGEHAEDPAHPAEGRLVELDAQIRNWPRRPGNDPYKEGLERLAEAIQPMLPTDLFAIGYNEFCRPSILEVLEEMIGKGATRVLVIPSMLTPGGVHSEIDIPRALGQVRKKHPAVGIEYLWPFDLNQVAGLLAGQIRRRAARACGNVPRSTARPRRSR